MNKNESDKRKKKCSFVWYWLNREEILKERKMRRDAISLRRKLKRDYMRNYMRRRSRTCKQLNTIAFIAGSREFKIAA